MSKIRMHNAHVSPEWFDDDRIGTLPALTRLLFLGHSCIARCGKYIEATPAEIKHSLLKYNRLKDREVSAMLKELEATDLIVRRDGKAGQQIITLKPR